MVLISDGAEFIQGIPIELTILGTDNREIDHPVRAFIGVRIHQDCVDER